MDWNEPSIIQSVNSKLNKSNENKNIRRQKYCMFFLILVGYAFSVDEDSTRRNSVICNVFLILDNEK